MKKNDVGPNRRKGDRRIVDLGGPPEPVLETQYFTRFDAIERLLEEDTEMIAEDRSEARSFIWEVLSNGFTGKPYNKWSNKALAQEIYERMETGEKVVIKN